MTEMVKLKAFELAIEKADAWRDRAMAAEARVRELELELMEAKRSHAAEQQRRAQRGV